MIVKSNPFLRNDYYPDYNDIDQLNQRIDEAENETSLVNIRLTADIENVSNNLNSYKNEMADTVVTNNIIVNNLDANYAVGKYANFANTNTDNAYIENLTVNKPVFDITLNTPHVENITSINGNFYDSNLINPTFENVNSLNLNYLNVDNLAVNKPVFDITLNTPNIENANSIGGNFYDSHLVNPTFENVDSLAVNNLTINKPMFNLALNTPNIENANSIGGDFYNATLVNPTFEELDTVNANSLNVNSANVAELFVNTNSEPITSNAILGYDNSGRVIPIKAPVELPENANYIFTDEHGTALPGKAETEVNASDNLITSNAVKNVTDNLASNVDYLKSVLNVVLSLPATNVSGWNNSVSPLNIQSMTDFVVFPFSSGSTSGADVGNGARLDFDSASKVATLYIPGLQWTMGNMDNTFNNCRLLNQNILISDGVTHMKNTFASCRNLNQNISIPNSVTSMHSTFANCTNLNQNILIPDGVTSMYNVFANCTNLNQDISIPSSVTNIDNTFENCRSLNQNILIPNSVTSMYSTFQSCTNLNQNILIPNGITSMYSTFQNCRSLNQNILIPNSVTSMYSTFQSCTNLNQNILIPNSVTSMDNVFVNCRSLNQNILIPGSVRYMDNAFKNCINLNIPDMYIYSHNIKSIDGAFNGCNRIGNIHVPTIVPLSTSNYIYNSLVGGDTGITFAPENVFNDLPSDPEQWPPV